MKQRLFLLLCLIGIGVALRAEVKVKDVSVKPRWPWNGLVDITYSIECDEKENGQPKDVYVVFSGRDQVLNKDIKIKTLTGDGAKAAVKNGGPYMVTWNAGKDCPNYNSAAFVIKIHAMTNLGNYLVVNLVSGEVRYTNDPPNLSDNTCRTTELWLRQVKSGTYTIGSNYEITLTQLYYIGIFECTQRQWKLIKGSFPDEIYIVGDTLPAYWLSYEDIRGKNTTGGAGWPAYGHDVDETSFMGKLREKVGMIFDLPTEAQWEVAARGGDQSQNYNYSGSNNVEEVAWYSVNSSSTTHVVGSKKPNELGLYDMSGNVREWCLDWGDSYNSAITVDPLGADTGVARICRGGDWMSGSDDCLVRYRVGWVPSDRDPGRWFNKVGGFGFRIVCLPFAY